MVKKVKIFNFKTCFLSKIVFSKSMFGCESRDLGAFVYFFSEFGLGTPLTSGLVANYN